MATSSAWKLPAKIIAAFTDDELSQHMSYRYRFVMVQDPENLPEGFIERLTYCPSHRVVSLVLMILPSDLVVYIVNRDPTPWIHPEAHPLQPDQLTIRIIAFAAECEALSTYSRETADKETEKLWKETQRYHILCDDGGQPAYDISLLGKVSKEPKEYVEILWPWVGGLHQWDAFYWQLRRWQDFRLYQRYWRREDKLGPYMKGLKDRLASHDITRIYQLDDDFFDKDPVRQGKLETWIEYLMFEYIEHDEIIENMNRGIQVKKQGLKMIVDSDLFSEDEIDRVRDVSQPADLYKVLKEEQEKILGKAELEIRTVSGALSLPRCRTNELRNRLTVAESKATSAKKLFDKNTKKWTLVEECHQGNLSYVGAKKDLRQLASRIEWMRDQIRYLEYELGVELPRVIETKPDNQDDATKEPDHSRVEEELVREESATKTPQNEKSTSRQDSEGLPGMVDAKPSNENDVTKELDHSRVEGKLAQEESAAMIFRNDKSTIRQNSEGLLRMVDINSSNEDDATKESTPSRIEEELVQKQSAAKTPQDGNNTSRQDSEQPKCDDSFEFELEVKLSRVFDIKASSEDDMTKKSRVKKGVTQKRSTFHRGSKRSRCEDFSDHQPSGLDVVGERGNTTTTALDHAQPIPPRRSARIAKKQKQVEFGNNS